MDPYEAMQHMGLENLAGKNLDKDTLDIAYRALAKKWHPDLNPGEPEAVSKFKKIANAYERLVQFIGQQLPRAGEVSHVSPPISPTPGARMGAQSYSESDIETFAQQIVDLGYFQFVLRQKTERLPFTLLRFSDASIGSAEMTRSMRKYGKDNFEGVIDLIKKTMKMDNATYPTNIVAAIVKENWKEGWITYFYPLSEGNIATRRMFGIGGEFGYRSISFKAPPKRKQQKGVGMKRSAVEVYLSQNGLQRLYSGRNVYYGLPENQGPRTVEGEVIKLQPKVFLLVSRSRFQGKIHEIKIESSPYGRLTPGILDSAIKWVRRKAGIEEEKPVWKMTRGQYQELRRNQGKTDVTANNQEYWRQIGAAIDAGKPVPSEIADQYKQLFKR